MADTFRAEYRQLTKEQSEAILRIKHQAANLKASIDYALAAGGSPREAALAVTRLEEVVMWATKSIA